MWKSLPSVTQCVKMFVNCEQRTGNYGLKLKGPEKEETDS